MTFRKIVLTLLVLGLLMTLAPAALAKEPTLLVSPKGLNQTYWLTVLAGAQAAAKEFGAKIIWQGPNLETDVATQISIVEDYINRRVDGIVLAATDAKGLIPVVEKAQRAGIPVVTIDSGLDPNIASCYVATDNFVGGEKAGEALAKLIGYKGEVGLIPFLPGAASSIGRAEGFKKAISKYPGIKLVATQYSQSQVSVAMSVTEDMVTAHPNLAGIFAANEAGVVGALQTLRSRGLNKKVKLVGFDAAPNEIQGLVDGDIQALVVQNPFNMGYIGVKTILAVLKGQKVPKTIDTGVTVVTKDNFKEPAIQKLLYPTGH